MDIARRSRYLLAPARALPSFIIAGAQKGGTTSLFRWLSGHPRILPPAIKEIHFFDRKYSRGAWYYRAQFPLARALKRSRALTGEATPYYMFHPDIPRRMAALLPDARIIVCLRNPVDRAISHYWYSVHHAKTENLAIEEAFEREEERLAGEEERLLADGAYQSHAHIHYSYKARGVYVTQLRRILEHFDRQQVLVVRSEDLFTDPQSTFDRVLDFLDLPSHALEQAAPRNVGVYGSSEDAHLRERLQGFFEPYNAQLVDLLGADAPVW